MAASIPTYLHYIAAVLFSVCISLYAVRKIIFITSNRRIFDIPDNIRKFHGAQIPSLGGIGIFAGYIVTSAFFMYHQWYFVVAASVVLFLTGIYDDLMNMRPVKKLAAQIVASGIMVLLADIRISSLYGFAGIYDLSYPISTVLTILSCTFFINVFNFMDGIDGLACVLAILYTGIAAVLFGLIGQPHLAGISLCLAGGTIGLLWYNISPARIYMGDTGSMLLGFTIFTLLLTALTLYNANGINKLHELIHSSISLLILLLSVIFIPIFDALRVFGLRMMRGISPLQPDRTHLHYYLLDAGFTHSGALGVITTTNVCLVAIIWLLRDKNPLLLITLMTAATSAMMYAVYLARRKHLTTGDKKNRS